MPKRSSTGRLDLSQLAKHIVDQTTGETPIACDPAKSKKELALVRKRGGEARSAKLTPEQRSEIARNAAKIRWAAKQSLNESSDSAKRRKTRGVIRPPLN